MSTEAVSRRTTDPGVIHRPSSSRAWWTTGNVAEAVPGVLTPLTYTFWTRPFERSVRGSYAEMGVLSRADGRKVTDDPDETALGIVFGRAVLNVNLVLSVGAGLPGTNAAEVGANILGDTADDITALPPNTPLRYPVVAARLPILAARLKRRTAALDEHVTRVWRTVCAADAAQAKRMLPTIRELFAAALTAQSHATFLSSAMFEPLAGLVGDRSDLLADLLSGYGGMVEVAMLQELWEVAHERRTLDDWLSRYGYLAPYAGNLRSRSWREDPAPIRRLLATYRTVTEAEAPGGVERERVSARREAEEELLTGVPAAKRPGIRLLLKNRIDWSGSKMSAKPVHALYAALANDDMEGVKHAMAADVVIIEPASLPYGGTTTTRDAFFEKCLGYILQRAALEVGEVEVIGEGSRVAARFIATFTHHSTGEKLELAVTEIYRTTDDEITHIEVFPQDTHAMIDFFAPAGD